MIPGRGRIRFTILDIQILGIKREKVIKNYCNLFYLNVCRFTNEGVRALRNPVVAGCNLNWQKGVKMPTYSSRFLFSNILGNTHFIFKCKYVDHFISYFIFFVTLKNCIFFNNMFKLNYFLYIEKISENQENIYFTFRI